MVHPRPSARRPAPSTGVAARGPRALAVALAVAAAFLVGEPTAAQDAADLQINSEQYIVIDADTGEIFAQRGATVRNAMASLTKVFTAVQAIEEAPPDLEIVIDESDMPDPRASFMGFSPGETYTLEELLYGLMLPSGNDAAHAIARALGTEGPNDQPEVAVKRFVERMNQRVRDMGLTDTNLVRPDGWGVPGHYTTVRDLAAFMRYALQYPRFVDLISATSYTLHDGRVIYNNNRMLNWYEDLLGGKTGYDDDAGWCLIEVAERGDQRMISVTFDGIHENEDWYDDNRVLLEHGFEKKGERLTAGREIASEIVAFRDPDAAVIERMATSGASIGGRAAGPDGADSQAVPVTGGAESPTQLVGARTEATTFPSFVEGSASRRSGSAAAAITAVVAMILVARATGAFTQPSRRPRLTLDDEAVVSASSRARIQEAQP